MYWNSTGWVSLALVGCFGLGLVTTKELYILLLIRLMAVGSVMCCSPFPGEMSGRLL